MIPLLKPVGGHSHEERLENQESEDVPTEDTARKNKTKGKVKRKINNKMLEQTSASHPTSPVLRSCNARDGSKTADLSVDFLPPQRGPQTLCNKLQYFAGCTVPGAIPSHWCSGSQA